MKVTKDRLVIDYGDHKREVKSLVSAKAGDYVIVQVGKAVQKVKEKDALKSIKAWKQVQ